MLQVMAQFEVRRVIPASADAVFATITDLAGLPSWNPTMRRVIEAPAAVEPGAEWIVELHAMASTWRSRSRVEAIDSGARHFTYRSGTDDDNPSYARWTWTVGDAPEGADVLVAVELHPRTFWRRLLLARVRGRQLRRTELPASLERLAAVVHSH